MPKRKAESAPLPDPNKAISADPVQQIRTAMEAIAHNREHALASVPKSIYMYPEIASWRILQSGNLPDEAMASFVNLIHGGAYSPQNRPDNLPPGADILYHRDSPSRYAFLTTTAGWSVDGKLLDKVVGFGQNVFSLLGRAFRRRNMREAHSEITDEGVDDIGQGAY